MLVGKAIAGRRLLATPAIARCQKAIVENAASLKVAAIYMARCAAVMSLAAEPVTRVALSSGTLKGEDRKCQNRMKVTITFANAARQPFGAGGKAATARAPFGVSAARRT